MSRHPFAGTGKLVRMVARLDRIKLPLWIAGIVGMVAITPPSVRAIIEAEAETQGVAASQVLAQQAALLETNAASIALQGPPDALDTFGGRFAFEIGAFALILVGLMNTLLVVRHTRAEEETGRAELVRAAVVGPWSALSAVVIVAMVANAIVGVGATLVFVADGQAAGRSMLYGSTIALCGLIFGAIALMWAQVFEYGRAVTGASLATLAAAFALRAVGDVRDDWLSLLSPMGWVQAIDPFGEAVGWPFAASLVAVLVGVIVAVILAGRRDVGAGLVAQRPGPATAGPSLGTPLGFAWRLQRSTLLWWTLGIAFLGGVYGSVISTIDDFIEENESIRDVLENLGMSGDALRDGFVNVVLSMVALIASAGVIQALLRPRAEETGGRAEPVLSCAISRRAWLSSHLLLIALAAPVFMIASGLALAGADALVVGEFTEPGATISAALARVPALWAVAGIGLLLYGWAQRFALGVWAVFLVAVVVFLFGEALRLPGQVMNLSLFRHVTHLPAGDQSWIAIAVLCAIAVVSGLAGLMLFDRRDLDCP